MANPPSRKRSWRDAGPAPTSRPVDEAWRKAPRPARQEVPWWKLRWARISFVTAALLLVTISIIVVVYWFRPVKPMQLVLIGCDYDTNLFIPANVAGRDGVKELKRLGENWCDPKEVALDTHTKAVEDALTVPLLEKAPKTLIVFISAHGVARFEDGGLAPYLVSQDDDLHDGAARYSLDTLLQALEKLPDTQKLLLLDVTQVDTHWPLGELHNDFASALARREDAINKIKNLVVISSSGVDQRSWVSPEWGQTCFAHFVIKGLKGAADGAGTGKKNGRVDALELFTYVQGEVKRWVWHNRKRMQTPVKFGDDERARTMELVNGGASTASAEEPEEHANNYVKLKEAWEAYQKLRQGSPHPAVYAPHLWRRYLDMLLRAEQLLRAGNADAARKLLAESDVLYDRIDDSRSLKLEKSAELTLAMPAALGLPLKEQEKLDHIDREWKKDGAKLDEVFKDRDKYPHLLRAALAGQVVRNVATGPEKLLPYGRQSVDMLDARGTYCRPAEVHYLLMLHPDDEEGKPSIGPLVAERWPLVQKSLQVRLLAEHAALGLGKAEEKMPAYSEQVLPWIQPLVEQADKKRRDGQDLLFTSNRKKEWDQADSLLDEARKGYEGIQELAIKLRAALEVRDRVYAELPYYTHWVAEGGPQHEKFTIELWTHLHELDRLLDKTEMGEGTLTKQVEKLNELRGSIAKDFEELEKWVLASAKKENNHIQTRWHEIEAALAVPFLEPRLRMDLITASREISRDLFDNPSREGDGAIPVAETDGKQAWKLAERQGRLALAMLGDDWPESARIKTELDKAVEETWRNALTRAGETVGQLLNRLPEDADKRWEKAQTDDLKKTADEELRLAVHNARTIEGAAADTRMKSDPIDGKRRLDWHRLLCWQAKRTYLDWWAEWKQAKPHYYQRAAKIFLDDAEQVITSPNGAKSGLGLKRIEELREQLRNSPEVVVKAASSLAGDFQAGAARVNLTDESQGQERHYRLCGPDAKDVPGAPIMWVETQPKGQSGLRAPDEEKERKTVDFGPPISYRLKITADRPIEKRGGNQTSRHIVHGFFRGHESSLASDVRMYSEPDLTVSEPLKHGGGSVAVQTKQSLFDLFGPDKTAISIVLDCSGSMTFPYGDKDPKSPKNRMPDDRFHKATQALKSVLNELPDGAWVSLRAFGAHEFDEKGDRPEKERMRVWGPEQWNQRRRNKLIREVENLTPFYFTPLLRSITMASEEDFPSRQSLVARTVVVITDGGDSEFYDKDSAQDLKKKSGARRIPDYLKYLKDEFDEKGIQLIVIGFDVTAAKLPPEELKPYLEFTQAMKDMGFVYENAENPENLAVKLHDSLFRSYFRVDSRFGSTRVAGGKPIMPSSERPPYVPLTPGQYWVRVPAVRDLQSTVEIDSGDVLLLDLEKPTPDTRRPAFRRSMYAENDYLRRLHGKDQIKSQTLDGWQLAVLQNQRPRAEDGLHILATLQKDQGIFTRLSNIKQARPEWCWFEVPAVRAGSGPPHLQIAPVSKYPAPAWGLDLPRWQSRDAAVKLNAWWLERLPSEPHAILVRGRDFPDPFTLGNRNWRIGEQRSVYLESVTIEKQRIQAEEDGPKVDTDCLVVRLHYPPDQGPYFVRWPGWDAMPRGQEHRFYTEAGTYTGLFWTKGESIKKTVEKELKSLELYSVAELKKKALHPEELNLGAPNERWDRPQKAPVGKDELP